MPEIRAKVQAAIDSSGGMPGMLPPNLGRTLSELPPPQPSQPLVTGGEMIGAGGLGGLAAGLSMVPSGALLGGLGGSLMGAGRGNTPEGLGRGIIRGGMTTGGMGLGGGVGAGLGGALGQQLGHTGLGAAMGGIAGVGLGGLGGYNLGGAMMGEPVGAGKKKEHEKQGDATPDEDTDDYDAARYRLFRRSRKRVKKGDVTPEEDLQEEQPGGMPMPAGAQDVAMPPQGPPPPEGGGDKGGDKGDKPPGPEEVNLRQASSAANACAACGNFDGQNCGLLQMPVQPTQSCDAFAPSPGSGRDRHRSGEQCRNAGPARFWQARALRLRRAGYDHPQLPDGGLTRTAHRTQASW